MPLFTPETPTEVVYEDKSVYKAKGSVWHQKDRRENHIPEGVRALDTDCELGKKQVSGVGVWIWTAPEHHSKRVSVTHFCDNY